MLVRLCSRLRVPPPKVWLVYKEFIRYTNHVVSLCAKKCLKLNLVSYKLEIHPFRIWKVTGYWPEGRLLVSISIHRSKFILGYLSRPVYHDNTGHFTVEQYTNTTNSALPSYLQLIIIRLPFKFAQEGVKLGKALTNYWSEM